MTIVPSPNKVGSGGATVTPSDAGSGRRWPRRDPRLVQSGGAETVRRNPL